MDVLKRRYNIEDFLGEGWYPIEADSVVKWAWSKKESLLRFPADHSGFFLKFSACPIESIDLTVCHQDRQLYTDKFKDPNFTINIPPNITSCKISLEETWNPREVLGGLDDRQLGICLIEVSPLLSEICEHPPYTLELGLTSICNINPPCVMCPAQNLKQSKAQAHLSDVILDKIKPYFNSAKIVSLHGGEGEPLLSPRLFEFLSSIDTSNVYTLFATNGLLLTKGLSSKLISAGLREIQFSIDGATPLTYRKIRNNDGFFTLINNIKQLASLKKELGVSYPSIFFNMVVMKENISEVLDFIDLASECDASIVQLRFLVPLPENYEVTTEGFRFNYYEQRVDSTSEKFIKIITDAKKRADAHGIRIGSDSSEIMKYVYNSENNIFNKTNRIILKLHGENVTMDSSFFQREIKCLDPWKNIFIDLSGAVKFCCYSKQLLGNLNDNEFLEIWNGEAAEGIRKSFLLN